MEDYKVELFKLWAPPNSHWSKWAKPVLFASISERDVPVERPFHLPEVSWARGLGGDSAVVLDLAARRPIVEALGLVRRGFQPVPLFNSSRAPGMLVDVVPVIEELVTGAQFLRTKVLSPEAPPCFLLDSRRMESSSVTDARKFDNRWVVMPQDMPSANYLKDKGIRRVVVRSDKIQDDLVHILLRYQEAGLQILQATGESQPELVIVRKPSLYRSIFYRWSVLSGLKRNSTGGFGAYLPPTITSSSSGPVFYGSRMG